nr:hypothetical protein SHINE37_120103 [Rhizobiaceae bacterium]
MPRGRGLPWVSCIPCIMTILLCIKRILCASDKTQDFFVWCFCRKYTPGCHIGRETFGQTVPVAALPGARNEQGDNRCGLEFSARARSPSAWRLSWLGLDTSPSCGLPPGSAPASSQKARR